jgi:hypothetical protein
MAMLDDVTPNARVCGILLATAVSVVTASWCSADAIEVTAGQETSYSIDEPRFPTPNVRATCRGTND